MKTISGAEFRKLENGPCGKFPHSGPVYYGIGGMPYNAALMGVELKRADGKNRRFKSAEAAIKAIKAEAGELVSEAVETIEAEASKDDWLHDFNYVGSRHHY